jgi:hypothetical protein
MTADQESRFVMLSQGECVSGEYFADYYGLKWPFAGDLLHDYSVWENHSRKKVACPEGQLSRLAVERFMQWSQVTPMKWMGARLGMTEGSLEILLGKLSEIGLRPQRYVVYPELIAESLSEDIVPALPGLRFRTFSDHDSFCERLHAEIQGQLGFQVEPLFCSTSIEMEEYPKHYASSFDCLTLQPLSGRHEIWLNFHKPMNLRADRCSRLFYVQNQDTLGPYRVGTRDPDLTRYEQYVGGQKHDV